MKRKPIDDLIDALVWMRREAQLLYNAAMATKKKLTKAERIVQEQMLALLEYAERPDRWYDIGKLDATKKAAELLEKRSVIEIWHEINRYRLKPQK